MEMLTGAEILLKSLKEEGVDTIFGYPGGSVIDIYDRLVKVDLKHVLVRHEQGAVHAADGYARASGKVGVCLVASRRPSGLRWQILANWWWISPGAVSLMWARSTTLLN
jgi:glyoxylate carboligase